MILTDLKQFLEMISSLKLWLSSIIFIIKILLLCADYKCVYQYYLHCTKYNVRFFKYIFIHNLI